ncbi:MAG: ATP synthase F1 subunit delta [Nitrospirota bacterium]|nr:ATP synthase F1 subunit delta [Nitrospirota bacterium]
MQTHEGFPFVKKKNERISIVIKTAVARRYAQALFELLDASTIESTRAALTGLGEAIKDSVSLRHVVASPTFGAEEKIAVLAELGARLGCPPVGKTFLAQLVKKNRVGFLPEIAEAFAKLADASKGTQQITVSSTAALPPAEQDRISTRLREMLKRQVDVTFHTDARHLAGVQIQLGSTVVDSTVRGRLQAMQSLLTKE